MVAGAAANQELVFEKWRKEHDVILSISPH
jgi:hypothetical protein